MGLYGSAPKSPDPAETAAAQTGTNVATATANSYLGNINQVTPDGNLTYSYGESKDIYDPTTGVTYKVPTTTVTQTLSQQQQAIKNQEDAASLNLATLANTQSGRLNSLLANPMSLSGAPTAGQASSLQAPNYTQFSGGPNLQTSVNGGNIQNSIAGAGNIQNSIANAGNIQSQVGNAGDITRSYGTDYGANVQQVQDALMARLQPSLDQNRASLEQKLANQGLQPGSEAYNRALDTATRQENDARYGAILNAGQEQNRLASLAQNQAAFQNSAQAQAYQQALASGQFTNAAQAQQYAQNANNAQFGNAAQQQQFGQNQAQATFGNSAQAQAYQQALGNAQLGNSANQQMFQNQTSATAANNALQDQGFNAQQAILNAQNTQRSNYLNEQFALRNQNINEVLGLASGGQVSNPNFVPTQGQSIPTVDYAGLVNQKYQNDMAAYQQNQAGIGSLLGGIGSLFALSDKNAKKDVKEVGELKGHKLYEYRYKGEKGGNKHIGVLAQQVEKKRPDAVVKGSDGLRRVNYGKLFATGGKK